MVLDRSISFDTVKWEWKGCTKGKSTDQKSHKVIMFW